MEPKTNNNNNNNNFDLLNSNNLNQFSNPSKLLNQPSINVNHDLSIKKERGPPSLRKKQSQRFTVAHNNQSNNLDPPPPPPPLPTWASSQFQHLQQHHHHQERTPSTSSIGDSDYNPSSDPLPLQQTTAPYMSNSSNSSSGAQYATVPYLTSPITTRTNTSLSGNVTSSIGTPLSVNNVSGESDDEVIPTAIVIKNIPFSVRREQLLAILDDLMIPAPYAFNYHFDNGVFRGLAFANFRSASEADSAVAGLNGFDISGRKLRVEYKKVLQAGEKERIEKEKAIKRMRSMQLQKDGMIEGNNYHQTSHHFGYNVGQVQLDDDLMMRQQQQQILSNPTNSIHPPLPNRPITNTNNNTTTPPILSFPGSSYYPLHQQSDQVQSQQPTPVKELDMNDPQTLELYSRIVIFKEDNFRDEFSFAKSLTSLQRRIVHQIAKKLGLDHRSEGIGEERFVVVSKPQKNNNLKIKKSMPNLRRLNNEEKNYKSLNERKSNINLRYYNQNLDQQELIENNFNNLMLQSNNNHHPIIRQPKGPEVNHSKGFGHNFKVNNLPPGQQQSQQSQSQQSNTHTSQEIMEN
ncbi:hypothetical protein CROQUDRAFT_663759 [Cronartium quercuum f. sp. fusiforme G11]|uniref:R3H domain-containing protein n=1 Tax=Cronartium quercuum f. sp. fusiforme G11 TaxID=708437 RepID=A0A9P6N7V6_9BASI|nr:hypothetical protein CROQUDRAFT_663759 [Cronartium quercuum f. sp. fusiforme G11]